MATLCSNMGLGLLVWEPWLYLLLCAPYLKRGSWGLEKPESQRGVEPGIQIAKPGLLALGNAVSWHLGHPLFGAPCDGYPLWWGVLTRPSSLSSKARTPVLSVNSFTFTAGSAWVVEKSPWVPQLWTESERSVWRLCLDKAKLSCLLASWVNAGLTGGSIGCHILLSSPPKLPEWQKVLINLLGKCKTDAQKVATGSTQSTRKESGEFSMKARTLPYAFSILYL